MRYNTAFTAGNHQIAMPPPLSDDAVQYADGTKATTQQEAHDVVAFLSWAAEPQMEARKRTGFKVILFLLVMTGLFYAVKRKVWADLH
jgi:cytochrome c1